MSDQESENEQVKSSVNINATNPNTRCGDFAPGDMCQMSVRQMCADGKMRICSKKFTIRDAVDPMGRWKYQLNDADTGEPYKGDTWFSETDLGEVEEG
jgi:hypothetical protein